MSSAKGRCLSNWAIQVPQHQSIIIFIFVLSSFYSSLQEGRRKLQRLNSQSIFSGCLLLYNKWYWWYLLYLIVLWGSAGWIFSALCDVDWKSWLDFEGPRWVHPYAYNHGGMSRRPFSAGSSPYSYNLRVSPTGLSSRVAGLVAWQLTRDPGGNASCLKA